VTAAPHTPVLLAAAIDVLGLRPGMRVADLTVGYGGHAEAIARRIGPEGVLYAFDQDETALDEARRRLEGVGCRVVFLHANFRHVARHLGPQELDAALADLGVASPQVDDPRRGFSFRATGPLDMRMDPSSQTLTAYEVVNTFPEARIAAILREYGEEPFARRIARRIVERRQVRPIATTSDLVDAVVAAVPEGRRRRHPARRTFQALRIYVNDELGALQEMLDRMPGVLVVGGRLAVISFHSLEDRLVKRAFRRPEWEPLTPKPVLPSREEVAANPRARPAKLRAARLLGPGEEE
jgi:16S rRNA (cytosine1402-N4)-methyltransferase